MLTILVEVGQPRMSLTACFWKFSRGYKAILNSMQRRDDERNFYGLGYKDKYFGTSRDGHPLERSQVLLQPVQ